VSKHTTDMNFAPKKQTDNVFAVSVLCTKIQHKWHKNIS